MIVRILGEGQYDIAESDRSTLDGLDVALNEAVEGDDDAAFLTALAALIGEVRRIGTPLAADQFTSSDLVVPFSDATLAETKALLAEPGGDDH
ncbi:MAG: hypothetical protein ABSF84_02140 [Acidimicrobiales bacterium]|jgi:hypothetical protein